MTTGVQSPKLPRPVAWLLAPLRWLERARGRGRLALAMLYLMIIAAAMVLGWRATSLNRLPDIGDPFDIRAFTAVQVPDAENAFVLYRKASDRYKPTLGELNWSRTRTLNLDDWSKARPEVRRWLEVNREALELWRRGTERPKALYIRPGDFTIETRMPVIQRLREFAWMALLEASRRAQSGDVAGAWALYRGVLRASRHVGQYGGAIQRVTGRGSLAIVSPKVLAWAADPKVDAALLRRALADIREIAAMTPPNSHVFQMEYLAGIKALRKPQAPWIVEFRRDGDFNWYHYLPGILPAHDWLLREPERSQRVCRLVFANWLSACDLPPGNRPPKIRTPIELYRASPPSAGTGPQPARSILPEELESWIESAKLAQIILPNAEGIMRAVDAERSSLNSLIVALASELYAREHSGASPKSPDELVGPYLDRLPDNYTPMTPKTPVPTP